MKKVLTLVSLLLAVVLVFAACSKSERPLRKEADVKVVTPQKEETASAQPDKNAPAEQPREEVSPKTEDDKFIGEERARQIALERAGLGADEVIFERVELDFDDGIWEYEVEFRQGRTEYSADIKADDGTIVSWEKDIDD